MGSQQPQRPYMRFSSMFRNPTQRPAPATATAPQTLVRPPAPPSFRASGITIRPPKPQEPTPPPSSQPTSPPALPPPPSSQPIVPPPSSPPSTPPPQPQLASSISPPSRPTAPLITRSPISTSGQRSPVGTPSTRSPISTPPTTRSPTLTSRQPSPVSQPPTSSNVEASPKKISPLHSPTIKHSLSPPSSSLTMLKSHATKIESPPQLVSPSGALPPSPQATHEPLIKAVSPLKLPKPAQALYDQKNVAVQETAGRRSYIPAARKNHLNKESEQEESSGKGTILTLAGENKGAIMDLIPPRKKYENINGSPQKLFQKEHSEEEEEEEGSGSDEESEAMNNKGMGMPLSIPMMAFMNSNVQGVNNSILHNTTYSHHDPGIHLVYAGRSSRRSPHDHLKTNPKSR